MTKTQKGIALIVLSFVLMWGSFYIGRLLDVGNTSVWHWYDIPFLLTSFTLTLVVFVVGASLIHEDI